MRARFLCGFGVLALALVACTTVDDEPVVIEPGTEPTVEDPTENGGLIERLPDTCKLPQVMENVGQPASVVPALGLTRPYRIVGPNDIVTQEYNPARVNFYTNSEGIIVRIACG